MVAVSEHARAERSRSTKSTPPLCGTCCGECICHLQVERPAPRQGFLGRIREDVQTVFAKDPAARGLLEVLTCYPGLHAIWLYRIAHALWRGKLRFFARLVSHVARWLTGIEIHPGATIGRRVFIDHGMGVVVGETAEVGDDVLIYKGVVLGGVSQEKKKRHPTVCRGVILGSNATILGPIEIGAGAKIGSGAVVVKPVPPCTTVVGVPGRVVRVHNEACPLTPDLRHNQMPDDVSKRFAEMEARIAALEARLAAPDATKIRERAGNNGKDG